MYATGQHHIHTLYQGELLLIDVGHMVVHVYIFASALQSTVYMYIKNSKRLIFPKQSQPIGEAILMPSQVHLHNISVQKGRAT